MGYIHNGIGHFDVSGPDLNALQKFYEGVFAWSTVPKGPGYALVETPEGTANGALNECETPGLTIGVVVPNLEAAVASATKCGGSVVMPTIDNG